MATAYPAITTGGAVTSFVPLTTAFTPSAKCSRYFRLNGPSLVAFDPGYGLDIDPSVRCVPNAVTTWWEQGRLGNSDEEHTAVSLGPLTCPYEWSTVVSSVENESSTLAMCCPSGYYLGNGIPGSVIGDCLSTVSQGMVLTYASTAEMAQDEWHTETTTLTRSSTVGAIAIVGWNIELPTSTSSTTDTTSTLESIPVSSSSPHPSSSSPSLSSSPSHSSSQSSSSSKSHQINQGAIIGIGVGVGLGVGGIALVLAIVCLMRRRKKKNMVALHQPRQNYGTATTQQTLGHKHELYGQQMEPHELPGEFQSLPQREFRRPLPPMELSE
ncbi:hypothetical protein NPX13_g4220 [Xylaria arbuscula]|uniref:Uncharacterized protein n=1 Tax=Xylaria arbuscula TaxID=114810 RepID=A0A9W8NFW7_9PEZI|nr:hypothetical protein NPX13_g4220 [Xylaria arbuscula]